MNEKIKPSLTAAAYARFAEAQQKGLFSTYNPGSLVKLILEQEIVTECNSKASACFDVDDLI